jgi:hypothetical protein
VFLLALAGCGVAGCDRDDAPLVAVVNASAHRLEGLWVRTEEDSVRVPTLAPGASAEVRPHVRGATRLSVAGTFAGRRIVSDERDYVERSGGYRFRAVVDSSGRVTLRFVRMDFR